MQKENGIKGFEFKKAAPWLGLAAAGICFAFFANPNKILELLRREHKNTFQNLLNTSNEKEYVKFYLECIPDGTEPVLAEWINDAMSSNSRRIARGQVKPHHVMYDVLDNACLLVNSGRKLESKKKSKK